MQTGEIIIYQTEDGRSSVEVKLEEQTIWLTQAQIVDLFSSSKANINEHIKHIYQSKELQKESTVRKFRTVRKEGKREVSSESEYIQLRYIKSFIPEGVIWCNFSRNIRVDL